MSLFWTRAWDAVAGVVFPTPCVSCGELIRPGDPPLCAPCWADIRRVDGPVCGCGAPLPDGGADVACARCRRGLSRIAAGAALGWYTGSLRDCVVALKYHGRHRTAERLASRICLDARCAAVLNGADVLVPVPLHPARERERGFNQSMLLADAIARILGMQRADAIVRKRQTRSQTDLSARERRLNVRDAFGPAPRCAITGSIAVLVDDVTTTGATLRECSGALLAMGVREVRCITAARAE